jgi:hypothetical protein
VQARPKDHETYLKSYCHAGTYPRSSEWHEQTSPYQAAPAEPTYEHLTSWRFNLPRIMEEKPEHPSAERD